MCIFHTCPTVQFLSYGSDVCDMSYGTILIRTLHTVQNWLYESPVWKVAHCRNFTTHLSKFTRGVWWKFQLYLCPRGHVLYSTKFYCTGVHVEPFLYQFSFHTCLVWKGSDCRTFHFTPVHVDTFLSVHVLIVDLYSLKSVVLHNVLLYRSPHGLVSNFTNSDISRVHFGTCRIEPIFIVRVSTWTRYELYKHFCTGVHGDTCRTLRNF